MIHFFVAGFFDSGMTSNNDPHHFEIQDDEPVKLEDQVFPAIAGRRCGKWRIGLFIIAFDFIRFHIELV
jgi:hypothetical protein